MRPMQKEIEAVLKKYGFSFQKGYMVSDKIYETVFQNRSQGESYIMKEVKKIPS